MAEPIAPSVGSVPSANAPIKTLDKQVAPQYETPAVNYGSALTSLANTPSLLGEIGSQLSTNASVALNQRLGQYYGANPSGELFPPITRADKAFADSYNTQAATTLSLQATKMLNEAHEEISQSYLLTPGAISNYSEKMTSGIENILKAAPSAIRPQLENQLGHQVLNTTHQLQEQRLNQQKEITAQNSEVHRMQLNNQLVDAQRNGNWELADSLRKSLESSITSSLSSGMISPVQAQTARDSVEMNYLTGQAIHDATAMRNVGGGALEDYLSRLPNSKPHDVSWQKWDTVMRNTASYVGQMENMDNRHQSLLYSQGQEKIADGSFNSDSASYYKENLKPSLFSNLMTSYYSHQRRGAKSQYESMQLAADWGNADAFVGKTKDVVNKSYDSLVDMRMQNAKRLGQPISQEEAEFQTAASSAAPVPKFIDKINIDAKNGTPEQIQRAIQNYTKLNAISGNKVLGVSQEALAMMNMYPLMLAQNQTKTPEEAAQMARDVVFNKTPEVFELNKNKTTEYLNKNVKPSTIDSWAIKNSGFSSAVPRSDSAQFNSDFLSMFTGAMQLTNGETDSSIKMASDGMRKLYSVTEVNGTKQITKYGLEHTTNLTDSAPLYQQDIINRLAPQLQQSKDAFDKGAYPSYWRFKEGRVSHDEYMRAKEATKDRYSWTGLALANLKGESPALSDIRKDIDVIKEFESAKPIEIEQVFKDGTVHTYNLNMRASPIMQKDESTGNIIGDYDVQVVDQKTGRPHSMNGYWGGAKTTPTYRPDNKWVQDNYSSLHGKPMSWVDYQEQESRFEIKNQRPFDFIAKLHEESMNANR